MEFGFADTDTLPVSMVTGTGALKRKFGLNKGSPAVEKMIECWEKLSDQSRAMLLRDAMRTNEIVGRDLKAAAMAEKRSAVEDYDEATEPTEYASLDMDDDLTGRRAV
jgi:hypothetical protein